METLLLVSHIPLSIYRTPKYNRNGTLLSKGLARLKVEKLTSFKSLLPEGSCVPLVHVLGCCLLDKSTALLIGEGSIGYPGEKAGDKVTLVFRGILVNLKSLEIRPVLPHIKIINSVSALNNGYLVFVDYNYEVYRVDKQRIDQPAERLALPLICKFNTVFDNNTLVVKGRFLYFITSYFKFMRVELSNIENGSILAVKSSKKDDGKEQNVVSSESGLIQLITQLKSKSLLTSNSRNLFVMSLDRVFKYRLKAELDTLDDPKSVERADSKLERLTEFISADDHHLFYFSTLQVVVYSERTLLPLIRLDSTSVPIPLSEDKLAIRDDKFVFRGALSQVNTLRISNIIEGFLVLTSRGNAEFWAVPRIKTTKTKLQRRNITNLYSTECPQGRMVSALVYPSFDFVANKHRTSVSILAGGENSQSFYLQFTAKR